MAIEVFPQLRIRHNRPYFAEQGNIRPIEGGSNCGAAGGAGQCNFSQKGQHVTHHQIRLAAGNPGYYDRGVWIPTGLSTQGITDAINHFGGNARRYGGVDIGIAMDALAAGKAVGFGVQYSTINSLYAKQFSGDRHFMDGHFLVCYGWRSAGRSNYTGDWDSLLDGRPKRYTVPKAVIEVPFRLIRLAAADFLVGGQRVGDGKGTFVVAEPA